MARRSFRNRVSLRKALRSLSADDLKRSAKEPYVQAMRTIKSRARSNAPRKSGKLRSSIKTMLPRKRGARSGKILTGYVYAETIYDKMQHSKVPVGALSKTEADDLSRKWRGKSHRVNTGKVYSKVNRRGDGKIKKGSRGWAWGVRPKKGGRDKTGYMTKGQNFQDINDDTAQEIGSNILKLLGAKFNKQVSLRL